MTEPRLDRTTILDAAERLADRAGAAGLTMRSVGAEIGADPTAVYRHFRNKNELLAALADRLFGQLLNSVEQSGPWQSRLRSTMRRGHALYRAHPSFADALAATDDDTPNLQRIAEYVLTLLLDAGLSPPQAALFYHLVTNTVVGTGLFHSAAEDLFDEASMASVRRSYASLDPTLYPSCIATAEHLYLDANAVFELNIDLLIAAIQARVETPQPTRR